MIKTATFIGGPIDGQMMAISDYEQSVFHCYVNMNSWVSKHTYHEEGRCLGATNFRHYSQVCRFVVETDQPDENGTTINLAGVENMDNLPILFNFSMDIKDVITYCKVWHHDGKLICEADLQDKWLDLNPAIGFQAIDYKVQPVGRHYNKVKLFAVGLCTNQNLNPSIKTVRDQMQSNDTP